MLVSSSVGPIDKRNEHYDIIYVPAILGYAPAKACPGTSLWEHGDGEKRN